MAAFAALCSLVSAFLALVAMTVWFARPDVSNATCATLSFLRREIRNKGIEALNDKGQEGKKKKGFC